MNFVALRMLTGDRAKYFGLVFAIAFCTFLLENQTSIFASIMRRTASQILDVTDAEVWVMDPQTEYFDQTKALKDTDLTRVRSVPGVAWAVRLFKGSPVAKTRSGKFAVSIVFGLDDAALSGAPRKMLLGSWERLREPEEAEAQLSAAESQAHAAQVEIARSTVCAPIDAEVLQVKLRVGEFAPAAPTGAPLVLLGRSKPLHVRVDVDEHEGWRVRPGAEATGHLRGSADVKTPLRFVRFEPFVIPKRSLTGDSTERVDTRVLQVIYRVERDDLPLFVGQQLDVFIDAQKENGAER
jgi:hypothetical protein